MTRSTIAAALAIYTLTALSLAAILAACVWGGA